MKPPLSILGLPGFICGGQHQRIEKESALGNNLHVECDRNDKNTVDVLEKKMGDNRDISKLLFVSQGFDAMKGYQPQDAKTKNPHKMTKLRKSESSKGIQ